MTPTIRTQNDRQTQTNPVLMDRSMVLIGKRHYLERLAHYQDADLPSYEQGNEETPQAQPVRYEPEHGVVIYVDGQFIEA